MNNKVTDSQMSEAIKVSDQLAFKELFYRYYPKLFRYAIIHIHSNDMASDLVQEVFFRVWENRGKLNSQKSIQAYLYKILKNLIINHIKLASSKTVSIEKGIGSEHLKTELDSDFQLDIQMALEKLPPKVRNVFVLIKMEGFKYNEAAEICGISVKAVEKRMTKALIKLREFLT